jgi:hypothetical protein
MQKTLKSLSDEIVKCYDIIDFKSGENFYFIKAKAELVDGSELHIKEYVSRADVLYSYHWQNSDRSLRVRWDNAPHHRGLRTYPHHKHIPDPVESNAVSLEDVMSEIKEMLNRLPMNKG